MEAQQQTSISTRKKWVIPRNEIEEMAKYQEITKSNEK